jgi:heme/copper-type cytochrome/quinol oxidase subunit 4
MSTLFIFLGEAEQTSLRQHTGNLLFTVCFLLVAIVGVIWWMKRNYM